MVLEAQGTRLTAGEEQLKRKFELILHDLLAPSMYSAKIEDLISLSKITGTSYRHSILLILILFILLSLSFYLLSFIFIFIFICSPLFSFAPD
jgi:hypothetical protein